MPYGENDELCHQADDGDEWWQESVALTAWDEHSGLGLFFRIGHEVGQGTATVWLGAVTGDGQRFRWYAGSLPLDESDRKADGVGVASAGAETVLDDAGLHWRVDRPEFGCDFALSDFFPMTNLWQLGAGFSLAKDFAPEHWEASGRLTGLARLGDRRFEITDGLYHRDHSWGTRRWDTLRSHRWVAGTTGPELSYMAMAWLAADGSLVSEGFVNRHGETTLAETIDIVTHVDIDGLSCRGGTVSLRLTDGGSLALAAEGVDGILTLHRNIACVDTICRVETADGRRGFCDFETTHNSRGGDAPVTVMVGAVIDDGLTCRR
jgi:hypothetical protein